MAREATQELFIYRIRHKDLLLYLASSKRGAVRVCIRMNEAPEPAELFARMFPGAKIFPGAEENSNLVKALKSALEGKAMDELPLDVRLTPFQHAAYMAISRIPYGHTLTYGQVAKTMGRPSAARAVGQAMKSNPLPLIFP